MDAPRFKIPLSCAVLDDPAFSPDPRSHPHFPLADARSYKAPSPPGSIAPVSLLSPPVPVTVAKAFSKHLPPQQSLLVPKVREGSSAVLKPVPTNIPRKARMKAFVRRLTARHNLDRIDELDETDPFGGSYHHDGPYEAIGSNLAQPTPPRIYSHTPPRGGNIRRSKRESDPHPLRASQYQILQQNPIYSTHASILSAAVPFQLPRRPSAVSNPIRPDHSRAQSLPNARTRPYEDHLSLDYRDGFRNQQSSSLRASWECHLEDYAPDIPNNLPLHHDRNAMPWILHQTEKTPPPRYESRLHSSGALRSRQHTPPPSFNLTSSEEQLSDNGVPAFLHHDSRPKGVQSLDGSHSTNSTSAHPSFSVQNKSSNPPRIPHLPKRLVMPAPLQPQPPQPQYNFPLASPPAWWDEYPVDHALQSAHFNSKPALYDEEPRLLRKKSSAFPAKAPIPNHVSMSQDDAVRITGNSPTKTVNEAEGTKGRTRRRRLSKRKNGI